MKNAPLVGSRMAYGLTRNDLFAAIKNSFWVQPRSSPFVESRMGSGLVKNIALLLWRSRMSPLVGSRMTYGFTKNWLLAAMKNVFFVLPWKTGSSCCQNSFFEQSIKNAPLAEADNGSQSCQERRLYTYHQELDHEEFETRSCYFSVSLNLFWGKNNIVQ